MLWLYFSVLQVCTSWLFQKQIQRLTINQQFIRKSAPTDPPGKTVVKEILQTSSVSKLNIDLTFLNRKSEPLQAIHEFYTLLQKKSKFMKVAYLGENFMPGDLGSSA